MTSSYLLPLIGGVLLLAGCAGVNSEFQFDKPAQDSGTWMAEADDMTASTPVEAHDGVSDNHAVDLNSYRLIDTGNIRLDVQNQTESHEANSNLVRAHLANRIQPDSKRTSVMAMRTSVRAHSSASCNARRCYPEASSAFRTPDSLVRVWISPYVSPDDNAHMGEIVYTVAKPTDWNGIL